MSGPWARSWASHTYARAFLRSMRTTSASASRTTTRLSTCMGLLRTRSVESLASAIHSLQAATLHRRARANWLFLELLVHPFQNKDQSDFKMGLSKAIITTMSHSPAPSISWPASSQWSASWNKWTGLICRFRPVTQKHRR